MDTVTKLGPSKGLRLLITCSINHWNTAGAFVKFNDMTQNSNNPRGVINAVFSLEALFILTCLLITCG